MKPHALYIIVEGATEEEFINRTFSPWLNEFKVYDVTAIKITTNRKLKKRGGNVNYEHFKNDVSQYLSQRKNIIVTSIIDFFRLPNNFPGYEDSKKFLDKNERVSFLEEEIKKDISNDRFIPYIQLHEFEALIFAEIKGFKELNIDKKAFLSLEKIMKKYPNPELINDDPETAPSKRLLKLINCYDKVLHGNLIIEKNTIETTLEKCPRLKNWAHLISDKFSGF